jgi:hypothetical protein
VFIVEIVPADLERGCRGTINTPTNRVNTEGLRLVVAITNYERGDDLGRTIITVCAEFYDTLAKHISKVFLNKYIPKVLIRQFVNIGDGEFKWKITKQRTAT